MLIRLYNFLYLKFIGPKYGLESHGRERILNVILVSLIFLTLIFDFFVLCVSLTRGAAHHGVNFFVFTSVVIFFCLLLYSSRKGKYLLASLGLVFILFLANTYASLVWGVGLPSSLLGYSIVILIAGLLINPRFSILIAVLISISIIGIGELQITHRLNYRGDWGMFSQDLYDIVEYGLLLFFIAIISWLSSREIIRSLDRAKNSELELKKERDILEMRVEQRSKEIQTLQMEKISQVYKMTEFGRLAAGLFHDLINALTVLSLNIEILKNLNQPELREEFRAIFKATHRLDDIMQAIRAQMHNREDLSLFSLNIEVNHAIDLHHFKAVKNNVKIIFAELHDLSFYGNPLKFFQIISNLISNAVDSFEGSQEELKRIYIKLEKTGTDVSLKVIDNGSGISPEYLGKIFNPFFSTKKAENGIGIGLSTVREIVENTLHGSIQVESELGKGTTFLIRFPITSGI